MKSANEKNRGFSLTEMLIAIFIIGVGLVGTLSFLSVNSANQIETKNELIAAGLAQEGTELVRNIADYKKLNGSAAWSDLVSSTTGLPACQKIDYNSLTANPRVCDNTKIDKLCFDAASGRYRQCASAAEAIGKGTEMTRTLAITCENSVNNPISCDVASDVKSLKIVCSVLWNDRTTTATNRLYENNY